MSKKNNASSPHFFILLVFSLIGSNTAVSQDSTYKASKPIFLDAFLLYDFPQSYGILAGLSYPYRSIVKNRVSKNGRLATRQKDKFWGVEAAVYRYPYNYTGLLVVPTIGVRHYVHRSFFYETSLGIGVLRTFYDGKVYKADASGNVEETSFFGRFYATTHLASSFNFLLQKPGSKIVALEIKPSIWFQYPFNSFIKPHISLEFGLKYEMNKRSTKTRRTIKHSRK